MPHYTLLLSLILFSSCEMLSGPILTEVKITAQVTEEASRTAPNTQTLKSQLKERLAQADYTDELVTVSEDGQQLIVNAMVDMDDEQDIARLRGLFASNTLALWDTYEVTDPEIGEWMASLPEIPDFVLNTGDHLSTVLGGSKNKNALTTIYNSLQNYSSSLPNLKLLWSIHKTEPFNGEIGWYELYLINTKGKTKAPISNQDVKMAEPEISEIQEVQIYFELNESATAKWTDMTRQAANDNNRSIAIVVNDRVYSTPRVRSEITGGQCVISGAFSMLEAAELAAGLGKTSLDFDLEIVSEEVVK